MGVWMGGGLSATLEKERKIKKLSLLMGKFPPWISEWDDIKGSECSILSRAWAKKKYEEEEGK